MQHSFGAFKSYPYHLVQDNSELCHAIVYVSSNVLLLGGYPLNGGCSCPWCHMFLTSVKGGCLYSCCNWRNVRNSVNGDVVSRLDMKFGTSFILAVIWSLDAVSVIFDLSVRIWDYDGLMLYRDSISMARSQPTLNYEGKISERKCVALKRYNMHVWHIIVYASNRNTVSNKITLQTSNCKYWT